MRRLVWEGDNTCMSLSVIVVALEASISWNQMPLTNSSSVTESGTDSTAMFLPRVLASTPRTERRRRRIEDLGIILAVGDHE